MYGYKKGSKKNRSKKGSSKTSTKEGYNKTADCKILISWLIYLGK